MPNVVPIRHLSYISNDSASKNDIKELEKRIRLLERANRKLRRHNGIQKFRPRRKR